MLKINGVVLKEGVRTLEGERAMYLKRTVLSVLCLMRYSQISKKFFIDYFILSTTILL